MSVLIPAGFAQAFYRFRLTGDPEEMVVTLGVEPAGFTDADELAAALRSAAIGAGNIFTNSNMDNSYSFEGVTVHWRQDLEILIGVDNNPTIGTAGGTALPSNCAYLVTKRTGVGGRRNKGRMYLPPFSGGAVTETGAIPGASVTSIQARLDTWHSALSTALVPHVLHSLPGVLPTEITDFTLEPIIATQRRRLR